MGCHHSLEGQDNNVVFKNEKARQIVENGAKTAFDVWYEWDKHIYDEDETFALMLEFVKSHNTQEIDS